MNNNIWDVIAIIIAIIIAVVIVFIVVPNVFATYPVADTYLEIPITQVFNI